MRNLSYFRTLMSCWILALGCLLSLSLSATAARKVRAIFISSGGSAVENAVLYTGLQCAEIQLPQRNFSPEVDLPEGELLVAILPKPLGAGEQVPAAAPKLKIPATWSRCIFLFFADPANPFFPVRVIPVNASPTEFPKGHTLIYNVSNATIRGKFGEESVLVRPGNSASFKPPIQRLGDYSVAIDCLLPGETKATSICRSSWQHDPTARQVLFITPAPGFKIPRVWGILDRENETESNER